VNIVLIVSQNLSNYEFIIPDNAVYRINLAWVNSIHELEEILQKHSMHKIFLDLPKNRTKPPNNHYSVSDLARILRSSVNIQYFAISNVNDENDLSEFLDLIPKTITIVPKIESPAGVSNIKKITDNLPYREKIIMLDHDDLFSALKKNGEPESKFVEYIKDLITFCEESNIVLLRTVGVVFSDREKRTTQYLK